MMMRRSVFDEVGGFDEEYQLVFSDVEICLRIRDKGYRNVYTPFARLRHFEGKSRGRYIPEHDVRRAYEQMRALVEAGDPYFNPNLSTRVRIPAVAQPGETGRERLERLEQVAGDHCLPV